MNEYGMSPADLAAVTGNNNNGGFGDGNGWWILLLFLFGWGGFGRGFGGGGTGANSTCATPADVNAAVYQQTLTSKLDQQTYGIADATYALNNSITSGFANAELSRCNQQAALMAQINAMQFADQKCCCETQRLIERGFCDTTNAIHNSTRDIIDNANCNTRAILDFLVKDKIDTLSAENQSLRLAASQAAQNSYLIGQLRPSPVPAYITCNPNAAGCGCGCGCA